MENADPALNISAMRNAVTRAVGDGEYEFTAVALVDSEGKLVTPSPEDLQSLHEFNPGILVVQVDEKGKPYTMMVMELYKTPVVKEIVRPTLD